MGEEAEVARIVTRKVAEAEEAMTVEMEAEWARFDAIDDATWRRIVAEADAEVVRNSVAEVSRIVTRELRACVYSPPGVSAGGPGLGWRHDGGRPRWWQAGWRPDGQVKSSVPVVCPGGSASGSGGGGGGDTEQIAELGGGNRTRGVISQVMEVLDLSQVIQDRLHLAGDAGPLHRFTTAVAAAKVALAMAEMASAVVIAKELDASPEAVAVEASHWERTKETLATAKTALTVMEIKEKIGAKKVKRKLALRPYLKAFQKMKRLRKRQPRKRLRKRQGHPKQSSRR